MCLGKNKLPTFPLLSHHNQHRRLRWHQKVWGLLSTSKQAVISAAMNPSWVSPIPIQFLHYPPEENSQIPQVGGSVPKAAPSATVDACFEVPGSFSLCFWFICYNSGFPQHPPQVWLICFSDSQNSGKHIYWFIMRDITEDTDEGLHRVRYGRRGVELPCPC